MKNYIPDFIYVDECTLDDKITLNVLEKYPSTEYQIIPSGSKKKDKLTGEISKDKKILHLRHNNAHFIERCPGTNELLCCNYFTANIAMNCHFDCTYCFLQSYLNDQSITIYTNMDKFLNEVKDLDSRTNGQNIRIGTGELADSLGLDELTGFSKLLVPKFNDFKNIVLEFKTKSNYIDNLLECKENKNTVISWSVNPPIIVSNEEHKCSSLDQRLEAAKKSSEMGYQVAFHFDPIILHDNWEENYKETVDRIFSYVSPKSVEWISLGVLRFSPASKEVIRQRFSNTKIIFEEMVMCQDGKLRYPQPVRNKMYRHISECIKSYDERLFTYLCMESTAVWNKVYGKKSITKSMIKDF